MVSFAELVELGARGAGHCPLPAPRGALAGGPARCDPAPPTPRPCDILFRVLEGTRDAKRFQQRTAPYPGGAWPFIAVTLGSSGGWSRITMQVKRLTCNVRPSDRAC